MSFPTAEAPQQPAFAPRGAIVIEDQTTIPEGVGKDLESFRRWAHSDAFPARGQFAFLRGVLWVDLTMEKFLTHNQVKLAFTLAIGLLLQRWSLGRFVPDRMLWTHVEADVSTEPDGLFFAWAALASGRLRWIEAVEGDYIELQGTPDLVLEIVSASSVNKDTVVLRDLYWRAGVPEYWLVDARGETATFEILQRTPTGYAAVEAKEGWVASAIFGHQFQLTRQTDPLGHPQFVVATRPVAL
jgi:Uma2 family endonuclease